MASPGVKDRERRGPPATEPATDPPPLVLLPLPAAVAELRTDDDDGRRGAAMSDVDDGRRGAVMTAGWGWGWGWSREADRGRDRGRDLMGIKVGGGSSVTTAGRRGGDVGMSRCCCGCGCDCC